MLSMSGNIKVLSAPRKARWLDRAWTARVESTLNRINPRYRRAIELRFFEDRGRTECADAMEVKIGTFDVLILRALRAFRRAWEEEHDDRA